MNNEVKTINGYNIKDIKAVRTYDTVALMKADIKLKEGQHVKTRGYYSVNDSGSSEYYITDTASETEYQENLNNGLYATLIIENGVLNLKSIGGKSRDNNFNNSNILQYGIEKAILNKLVNTIYIPSGNYNFNTPIDLSLVNLSSINIVGDGQNYTGNTGGTVLSYQGQNNSYLLSVNKWSRSFIKDINIVGTNYNNCFSINDTSAFEFRNLSFSNFLNNIWFKNKTSYVYLNECYFNCSLDGAKGVIINQHYTDGRNYTESVNAEYIFFSDCSFECGNKLSNACVIYGGEFIHFTRCDLCNSNDTALLLDSSGWKGVLLDIMTRDMSFCRNRKAISIITGNGTAGRFTFDGHFTRKTSNPSNNDRILFIDGTNTTVSYVTVTGTTDDFNTGFELTKVYSLKIDLQGEYGSILRTNSSVWIADYNRNGIKPLYDVVNPTATVDGNNVTYDFSNVIDDNFCGKVTIVGLVGGASSSVYVNFQLQYATKHNCKILSYSGANLSGTPTLNKKLLTIPCAYTPTTDTENLTFIVTKF